MYLSILLLLALPSQALRVAPLSMLQQATDYQLLLSTGIGSLKLRPTPLDVVTVCDQIDAASDQSSAGLLKFRRSQLLGDLLKTNRTAYISTVSFLGSRIPRAELPNLQEVPLGGSSTSGDNNPEVGAAVLVVDSDLTPDCIVPNVTFDDSILDRALLSIFRSIVQKEVGFKSDTRGIRGLLEEGRHYMLSPEGTPENQHVFVRRALAALLTPVMPPFYRLFMAGIVPSRERGDPQWLEDGFQTVVGLLPAAVQEKLSPGRQFGPLFYAPLLTSAVTPPFLKFLVGPSRTNLRKDGSPGGLVVEKCKFLQESNCKGLCLHQCKLPAQQFFADSLGLPVTVSPNFETQECQWSWGEEPLAPQEDPTFSRGCITGCATRQQVASARAGARGNLCDSF